MSQTSFKSNFRAGARDSWPFVFVATPFGLLFGVFATESGLRLDQTMIFTVSVFAGASQFTALQLLQDHAPVLIVLISALAVNLRVSMYSAALTPYLGAAPLWQRVFAAHLTVDQSYALSVVRFEEDTKLTMSQKMGYFFGTNALVAPLWVGASLAGAMLGARIPDSWAIDFALPITFLAMIGPMLRTRAHVVAALVGCGVSLLAAGVPHNLGLIIAGLAGMMAGAEVERRETCPEKRP